MDWRQYIESDPEILMGKPAIKGTRLAADFILGLFAARRMEDRRWAQGVGLVTAFAAVSILALASLRGEPEEYAFYWRIPLALGVVAVSIAALKHSCGGNTP